MKNPTRQLLGSFLVLAAVSAPARAQTGVLDQVSPYFNSSFNADAPILTWQQQVRAGISGRLEGFELRMEGPAGGIVEVRVRSGPAWNTTAVQFQAPIAKPTNGTDDVFVDVTSAVITLAAGDPFVIELHGSGGGVWVRGSSIPPSQNGPLYPEPLYLELQLPNCYGNCHERIGFETYMIPADANVVCAGDGSGAACPCGNTSPAGSRDGCLSSLAIGGRLRTVGNASIGIDGLRLNGTQMPDAPALYFQGTSQLNGGAGIAFGDGLRCAGGAIVRLATKLNVAGASQYPDAGDAPVSVQGQVTSPGQRTYQIWYRNAAAFCTPSGFNLTNGARIDWML